MRDPSLHHQNSDDLDADTARCNDLSALMDGELNDEEWERLAQTLEVDAKTDTGINTPKLTTAWHRYHLIGEVVRSGEITERDCDAQTSLAFAKAVMAQLEKKPRPIRLTQDLSPPRLQSPRPMGRPSTAINDHQFHWPWIGIAASVAAASILAWHTLNQPAPAPARPLYLTQQASPPPVADAAKMVVVETEQGVVIRDPRLEGWIHTHRQHGGASALQAPAGFLRAATLDNSNP
jgi:sigma-E factor negative regulatory protein RseA